ncbi:splicing factor U2AF-associated 2-like [Olea europaea subsp. europaea]|uniref:Splicing factor U2AF-associated 2-like n=1 Tax=Olea europaea subsp. europaea TaxID=158383 RepID=A0A8S0T3G7_OLEEU|nr:splicing factor U2AF-associated 2-like [Olea europaea subsp. europaea]
MSSQQQPQPSHVADRTIYEWDHILEAWVPQPEKAADRKIEEKKFGGRQIHASEDDGMINHTSVWVLDEDTDRLEKFGAEVVVGEVGRELLAAVAMADAGGFGAEH